MWTVLCRTLVLWEKIGIVLIVFHFEILLVDIKYYLLIG